MLNPEQEKIPQTIFVKKEFLDQIKKGSKTAEVRPGSALPLKPTPGEKIIFKSSTASVTVTVTSIETYKNLDYLLKINDLTRFGEGINKNSAKNLWKKLYPEYIGDSIIVINFKVNDNPRH